MSGGKWSAQEEAFLREHYPRMQTVALAEKLGRTLTAVVNHARRAGLRKETFTPEQGLVLSVVAEDTSECGIANAGIQAATGMTRLRVTIILRRLRQRGLIFKLGTSDALATYVASEERLAQCLPAYLAAREAESKRKREERERRRGPRTYGPDRRRGTVEGSAMSRVARVLREDTSPIGLSAAEIAAMVGRPIHRVHSILPDLHQRGEAFALGNVPRKRYFCSEARLLACRPAYDAHIAALTNARPRASRAEPHRRGEAKAKLKPTTVIQVLPAKKPTVEEAAKRRWKDMEPITPDNVKRTVCPSGTDSRYSFQPPPGWVGEFTRQWMEQRNQTGHARLMKGRK